MIKWTAVLLIIAVAGIQSVYSRNLPSFLRPCKRNDPNVSKRLQMFMKTLLKRSANGIPELKIPPIEPYNIPQIVIDQGASEAVKLTATLNNVAVYGVSKVNLTGVKAILEEEAYFEYNFTIPAARILSDYKIDGQMLVVPIKGAGKCEISLTDVSGVVKFRTQVVDRKGKKHLYITKRDAEVNVKNARFYFANLFSGNKELGERSNAFTNENWQELYEELRPVVTSSVGAILEYIVNIAIDAYTYDEIFPEK